MDPGKRDQLITVERYVATTDDLGEETKAWSLYTTAWAQVRRGTGQERRDAAQEGGKQTTTFVTDWNPELEAIRINDRINYLDDMWDITDVMAEGHKEVQLTAVRAL